MSGGPHGWSSTRALGPIKRCVIILRGADAHEDGTFTLRCAFCRCVLGRDDVTIDHLRPRADGGGHALTNLVPACVDCNTNEARAVPRRVWGQARRKVTPELRAQARTLALAWYPWLARSIERNRRKQRVRDARRRERKLREHQRALQDARRYSRRETNAYRRARDDSRRAA